MPQQNIAPPLEGGEKLEIFTQTHIRFIGHWRPELAAGRTVQQRPFCYAWHGHDFFPTEAGLHFGRAFYRLSYFYPQNYLQILR